MITRFFIRFIIGPTIMWSILLFIFHIYILPKVFEDNIFTYFNNRIYYYKWQTFVWCIFLASFYLENYFISVWFYFCLYVFITITTNRVTFFIKLLIFFLNFKQIFLTFLSWMTFKDIVLLVSKCLAYLIFWGSSIYNGLLSPSLYQMKYLNEFFLPCGTFFESNILLTSLLSILVSLFFFYRNYLCRSFHRQKYALSTHFILREKLFLDSFL